MKNKNLLDQFFLVDTRIIKEMIEVAGIGKNDIVLEIGAGSGNITRELAKKGSKIYAIEIDREFKKDLEELPSNVKPIFANALDFISKYKTTQGDKLVLIGNLPSSLVEPLMKKLEKINFKVCSFLIPLKFIDKLKKNKKFEVELIEKVSYKSFFPQPKTNWALVVIHPKPSCNIIPRRVRVL